MAFCEAPAPDKKFEPRRRESAKAKIALVVSQLFKTTDISVIASLDSQATSPYSRLRAFAV